MKRRSSQPKTICRRLSVTKDLCRGVSLFTITFLLQKGGKSKRYSYDLYHEDLRKVQQLEKNSALKAFNYAKRLCIQAK
mgnify:FL=1